MAHEGTGYFDDRGNFYKTPEAATLSDLERLLGKIGDGDSLAPGIAHLLLERRAEIERIFAEYDVMIDHRAQQASGNVTQLKV